MSAKYVMRTTMASRQSAMHFLQTWWVDQYYQVILVIQMPKILVLANVFTSMKTCFNDD